MKSLNDCIHGPSGKNILFPCKIIMFHTRSTSIDIHHIFSQYLYNICTGTHVSTLFMYLKKTPNTQKQYTGVKRTSQPGAFVIKHHLVFM